MTTQVLCSGCKRCEEPATVTSEAVAQPGLDTTVEKVTDYAEMAGIGVMSTPALAIDGRLAVSGSVPTVERVKDLLAATA